MAGITPISSVRVSDVLVRTRLLDQLQFDQRELFLLQTQLATGTRINVPSDDAPAALRSISIQRTLERKEQVQENVQTAQSFLRSSESAMQDLSDRIIHVRGLVVGTTGVTATQDERDGVAVEIEALLDDLVRLGNRQDRGRQLFAGTAAEETPFQATDTFVEFRGNSDELQTYADTGVLFPTSVAGQEVFGAISEALRGSVDLDPELQTTTRLSLLHGGSGASVDGAIRISDGTNSSTVDLSSAVTVGDVVRLIESNPPLGREIDVAVTGNGLQIELDSAGGNLIVTEVAGGTTAEELGILNEMGVLNAPLVGTDLNPAVTKTTRLDDLLGTKSQAALRSTGNNNDLLIRASTNGAALNDVVIQLTPGAVAGGEFAVYDDTGVPKTLTITVAAGFSTAADIAAAINTEGTFQADFDLADTTFAQQAGTAAIDMAATATTAGGSGVAFDRSGLQIENGGGPVTIDLSAAETVEDLLNELNGADLGVHAEINDSLDGINVRSRLSGADLTIAENGGLTATQLGIRSLTIDTPLADLNRGRGVGTVVGTDFTVILDDGATTTEYPVDISSALTIGDVVAAINAAAGPDVLAQLPAVGNGIEVVDQTAGVSLTVRADNFSLAAADLGFLPDGSTSVTSTSGSLTSEDRNTYEVDSIFNTLIRLRDALRINDLEAMTEGAERLDVDFDRLNLARAELGARGQALDAMTTRLEDEDVELRSALSQEIDTDFAEKATELVARQMALQASLQTTASILQLSVLDFI